MMYKTTDISFPLYESILSFVNNDIDDQYKSSTQTVFLVISTSIFMDIADHSAL